MYSRLSGKDYLAMITYLRGNRLAKRYTKMLCQRLDLNVNRRIGEYSTGNRRKLGLVAAFMPQPQLLMLDEPISGLDPLVQETVLDIVCEAVDAGSDLSLYGFAIERRRFFRFFSSCSGLYPFIGHVVGHDLGPGIHSRPIDKHYRDAPVAAQYVVFLAARARICLSGVVVGDLFANALDRIFGWHFADDHRLFYGYSWQNGTNLTGLSLIFPHVLLQKPRCASWRVGLGLAAILLLLALLSFARRNITVHAWPWQRNRQLDAE